MAVSGSALAAARVRTASAVGLRRHLPSAPALIGLAVVIGLGAVLASTSIVGRGDYGQWLMTSRFYLGEAIPDYRVVTALPPLVPMALALVQVVVPEPVAALQLVNVLLMAGLAFSLYAVGALVGRSPVVGVLSLAIGLLVTDRYLELFAFGGLLQAAAVMWTALAVAAFARAGRGPALERRWWVAGSVALALAALSHVGAGTVAVPSGLAVAAISLFRLRHLGWATLRHALVPVFIGLAAVAVYWLVVLLPASRDYVSNPASLGYRGPDRLFSALFDFWPTGMVIGLGALMLIVGSAAELARRSPERYLVLGAWAAVAWGSLGMAMVSGASTDFPRFAPVLLAPLVPACALAAQGAARSAARALHRQAPQVRPATWVVVCVAAAVVAATPLAVERYLRQTQVYQPRDAAALTAAVEWVDRVLPGTDYAVLTAVRDGKWLEGWTGREALFSLPVRYAFRPTEWERSVDADALLRSSAALTNGYFFVKYTDQVAAAGMAVPTGLMLGVNHGGEFVEVLRIAPSATRIASADGSTTAAQLTATGVQRTATLEEVAIRTDWHGAAGSTAVDLARVVRLTADAATLRLLDTASAGSLETTLLPPQGIAISSLDVMGREASICFTKVGASDPCIRVWAVQPDAVLAASESGGLRVSTPGPRLELLVTAETASDPAVGLGLLDPNRLVAEHNIGAALLVATDPAFPFRQQRLEALGFTLAHRVGPYAILLRGDIAGGVPMDLRAPMDGGAP